MYKIIWVSAGHGYRAEQNQTYPTRAEADAECKRRPFWDWRRRCNVIADVARVW